MNQYVLFLSFGCIFFTGHVQGMYWGGGEYVPDANHVHGMYWGGGEYVPDADVAALSRQQPVQEESNEYKLFKAVCDDNIDQVNELLKIEGIDLECKRSDLQETVLFYAARGGNPAIVQLLLDKGANPKAINSIETTVLHDAARAHTLLEDKNANFPKVVELLLKKGVEVNAPSYMGETPLHKAVLLPKVISREVKVDASINAAICKQLLRAGANRYCQYNQRTSVRSGYTPLHVAVDCNIPLAVQELIIFEPTTEELQHLVPGVWALEQLNLPKDLQEVIKRKLVSLIVNDKVALAYAYMAMCASGKTAYDVGQYYKCIEMTDLLETNVDADRAALRLAIATRTEIATMLDMNNDASRKALRLAVATRINELVKEPNKKEITNDPR